ncbi:hypothetical protein [Nonomuraea sp. NPDC050310]
MAEQTTSEDHTEVEDSGDDLEIHAALPVEPELVVVRKQQPPHRTSLI